MLDFMNPKSLRGISVSDYNYEALSPERFQQFCQALLARSFPNLQCLPVGQPDGGRDAFLLIDTIDSDGNDAAAFQVKFSRFPFKKTERDLIEEVIKLESHKISDLAERGFSEYYIITNVKGTSHLDSGSIDKVNANLSEIFGINTFCWWRDDLDRRLDSNTEIKWSYPEIISAKDIFPVLLLGDRGEKIRQRNDAIKAYIASQYDEDREVKFKQVELQNKLLDLFVDIPVRSAPTRREKSGSRITSRISNRYFDDGGDYLFEDVPSGNVHWYRSRDSVSDAAVLFMSESWRQSDRSVLEGAPGQGKSTITQFICQVHRIRLLGKRSELGRLSESFRETEVRIPFRVDLRDYAVWIGGKDPYSPQDAAPAPLGHTSALESFLAHQVHTSSGGFDFSVEDLTAVAAETSVLVVLDGFDEIADIPTREKIVKEISKSANRLEIVSSSLRMIVTSRPAAFANSPGFDESDWQHFELLSMTQSQIDEYADKWTSARRLTPKEKNETKNVLLRKLDQPHMRDLARNPMQLAILLTLINTRGMSLPDKRTALYDSYIELFFSREAEKSEIVRENRDLLIDIHRYLAWKLHSEAEEKQGGGSISTERLKSLLEAYLDQEGHDTSLVADLFQGVVERVVALVSRVQGTFEFEVQPLREYFAARHLYETAPYSPAGDEKKGTKVDRFEAISRNFYWLNVTRFYCGCYSRGELASLTDGIEDLARNDGFEFISYPRDLSIMLLGDWVFSQQPSTITRMIDFICSEPGFRIILAAISQRRANYALVIPDRCGRKEFVDYCKQKFVGAKQYDVRRLIGLALVRNLAPKSRVEFWMGLEPKGSSLIDQWIERGRDLDIFNFIESDDAESLCDRFPAKFVPELLSVGRFDILESDNRLFDDTLGCILDGGLQFPSWEMSVHQFEEESPILQKMSIVLMPRLFHFARQRGFGLQVGSSYTFLFGDSNMSIDQGHKIKYNNINDEVVKKCDEFLNISSEILQLPYEKLDRSIEPWSILVEAGRARWGEKIVFFEFSLMAAGIKSREERGAIGSGLFDQSTPLCARARYARLKSGSPKWWQKQIDLIENEREKIFLIMLFFAWATPRTINSLQNSILNFVDRLDVKTWEKLYNIMDDFFRPYNKYSNSGTTARDFDLSIKSERFIILCSLRLGESERANMIKKYIGKTKFLPKTKNAYIIEALFYEFMNKNKNVEEIIEHIKCVYNKYSSVNVSMPYLERHNRLPASVAEKICRSPCDYPVHLLALAERNLTNSVKKSVEHVGACAKKEKWF